MNTRCKDFLNAIRAKYHEIYGRKPHMKELDIIDVYESEEERIISGYFVSGTRYFEFTVIQTLDCDVGDCIVIDNECTELEEKGRV